MKPNKDRDIPYINPLIMKPNKDRDIPYIHPLVMKPNKVGISL